MASWITEGVSARSMDTNVHPVRHLLVQSTNDWTMWCSGGKARTANNPQSDRFCRECIKLANDAIEEGDMGADDAHGWPVVQVAG